jgi:TonB family protein
MIIAAPAGSIGSFRRALVLVLGLTALASPLAAQNLLYVTHGDKLVLVRRAEGNIPYVMEGGKWTDVTEGKFVLKPTAEFLPVFVSVKNLYVKRSGTTLVGSTPDMVGSNRVMNLRFEFSADLESPYALGDVFIMLAMDSKTAGGVLFLHGVGNLDARRVKHISIVEPMDADLGEMQVHLHIFVGGQEALNSRISFDQQEGVLNRMVAKRVATVQDQEVIPFVGPAPEYPASLLKTKIKGQAVVSFRVGRRGNVLDPAVTSASNPAFGTAALDAIRLWRFLPRVRNNVPVETTAEMPFDFTPPS